MVDNTMLPFGFPAVGRKTITAAFDGGRLTLDCGVMLLALAERRLGLAERLARLIPDRRDPTRITHTLADMIRARVFAICCGYEDAEPALGLDPRDLDALRTDPAFKLACGCLPDSGADLCSRPTLSRLENAPGLRDVIRLTYALVDACMDSYPRECEAVTLDIDDTCDVVHGLCSAFVTSAPQAWPERVPISMAGRLGMEQAMAARMGLAFALRHRWK